MTGATGGRRPSRGTFGEAKRQSENRAYQDYREGEREQYVAPDVPPPVKSIGSQVPVDPDASTGPTNGYIKNLRYYQPK